MQNAQKYDQSIHGKKIASVETVSEETQILNLLDKDLSQLF